MADPKDQIPATRSSLKDPQQVPAWPWPCAKKPDVLQHEEVMQSLLKGESAATAQHHFFDANFEQRFNQKEEDNAPLKEKMDEDGRLDYLLRMQKTMSEAFENTAHLHPHGLTNFDYKAIPDWQKPRLENLKMRIRRDNYMYLKQHPELDALMALFIQRIVKVQPKDPIKFTAEFFAFKRSSQEQMIVLVDEEKAKLKRYHGVKPWKPESFSWWGKGFKEVNEIKSLAAGALAQNFQFTPPPSPPVEVVVKSTKKFYCGCKDKSRRATSHLPKLQGMPVFPEDWNGEAGLGHGDYRVDNNYFGELEEDSENAELGYDGDTSNEEAFTDDEQ